MSSDTGQLTLMKVRLIAGMTQEEFAKALGVTPKTVSNWERGVQVPRLTFEQTQCLLDISGLTVADLVKAYEGTQATKKVKRRDSDVKT